MGGRAVATLCIITKLFPCRNFTCFSYSMVNPPKISRKLPNFGQASRCRKQLLVQLSVRLQIGWFGERSGSLFMCRRKKMVAQVQRYGKKKKVLKKSCEKLVNGISRLCAFLSRGF